MVFLLDFKMSLYQSQAIISLPSPRNRYWAFGQSEVGGVFVKESLSAF